VKWTIAWLALLLTACGIVFVPRTSQIEDLERTARNVPCIGDPANWSRIYWIDSAEPRYLRFSYGKPLDRFSKPMTILKTYLWERNRLINDAPQVASGRFDLSNGKMTVEFCGSNF
jgi:hypothetical protein